MHYYAKVKKQDGAFIVSFPDVPNVNTYGDTLEEALSNAAEALNGALESDFERGYTLPEPKPQKGRDYHVIEVLPHIELPFRLRQLRKGQTQTEIARKLGLSYQAYQRLENPRRCNPTLKNLERLSQVFGRRVELSFT
jgi:antitoxin HicB